MTDLSSFLLFHVFQFLLRSKTQVIGGGKGWVSYSVPNKFKRWQFKAREHGDIGIESEVNFDL